MLFYDYNFIIKLLFFLSLLYNKSILKAVIKSFFAKLTATKYHQYKQKQKDEREILSRKIHNSHRVCSADYILIQNVKLKFNSSTISLLLQCSFYFYSYLFCFSLFIITMKMFRLSRLWKFTIYVAKE